MTLSATSLREELAHRTASLGNAALTRDTLGALDPRTGLVRFVQRYTLFNGNFAGGVAGLAGAFHVRQDLFRDPAEPIAACADRSARIASHIAFAAEDEYSDREDRTRITHRDLGQAVLRGTVEHFGLDAATFDQEYPLDESVQRALARVLEGYGLREVGCDVALFRGLGFHIASEISADEEFNAINSFLRAAHPRLVEHLSNRKTHLGQPLYRWFDLHTYVEVEHHEHALEAAAMALDFYTGDASREELIARVMAGIDFFGVTLREIFHGVSAAR